MSQHKFLVEAALKRNIKIQDVSQEMQIEAAIFTHSNESVLIKEGIPMSWLTVNSKFYCDNKQLAKKAFEALQIPHPKSILFASHQPEKAYAFLKADQQYVCKPLDGMQGDGVQMNLQSIEDLNTYLETYNYPNNTPLLLEEQVAGEDLRIHIINKKIVAACIRRPAFVKGDGKNSLQQLIEIRRKEMLLQNPMNQLNLDEDSYELLEKQGITLESIPQEGQEIQLKYISNMAQGGVAIDVTHEIHPQYHLWAEALCNHLDTSYMAMDFLCQDYNAHPDGISYLLELNACADWMHHTFSEKRTHDMPKLILDALF